jgi:23S rRNA (adenine2503-C2)-methyltransferase
MPPEVPSERRSPARALANLTETRSMPVTKDVLGLSEDELRSWMVDLGEPAFRGSQLYHALYAELRRDFASMTNLPAAFRTRLESEARIGIPKIASCYQSADGSVRYLLALAGNRGGAGGKEDERFVPGARVETVFMPSEGRQTICVSTQAGCAVDCHFCLTAQLGLIRNLTAGEIVGQVLLALEDQRDSSPAGLAPRTNVVLMGQGEPLLNYEPVMSAVRIMLDPKGMVLAARHVTLSTSGILPGIERLAQETIRPNLAISLNASSDEQRDVIMPINRKYPLAALLDACRRYPLGPRGHITFEYVLLGGFNDSPDDARRVAQLLSGLSAKVNLIPWNPGALPYRAPEAERVEEFRSVLLEKGILAFVRYSRGRDIAAACGQLALIETTAPAPAISSGAAPRG